MEIKDLTPYYKGWSWTIERDYGGYTVELDYHTNSEGEGLFMVTKQGDLRQLKGTCDFYLLADTVSEAEQILKDYYGIQ